MSRPRGRRGRSRLIYVPRVDVETRPILHCRGDNREVGVIAFERKRKVDGSDEDDSK